MKCTKLTPFTFCLLLLLASSFSIAFAQNASYYLNKGKEKIKTMAYYESLEDLNKAIKLNPQLEEAFYLRGQAYFAMGFFDKARLDFNRAIQYEPGYSLNYFWRGKSNVALDQLQMSLWDFGKAIEISSGSEPSYLLARAQAYLKLGRANKALEDAQDALEIQPENAMAYSIIGLVYMDMNKEQKALANLKRSLDLGPELANIHFNFAEYYDQMGNTEKAIEEYSASINLDSRNYEPYFKRALLKLKLGDDLGAQRDANRSVLHNRRFYKAYALRGIASFNLEENDRYEADERHYLSHTHSGAEYYFFAKLVADYAKGKNYKSINTFLAKSEQWAHKALIEESNYENNLLYAQILFKLNQSELAKKYAQEAVVLARRNRLDDDQAETLLSQVRLKSSDQSPPKIQIIAPIARNRGVIVVEAANKLTVIGIVSDESGIDKVLVNGNPARVNKEGQFDGEAILRGDENFITVRALDRRGNEAKVNFTVRKQAKKSNRNNSQFANEGINRALLFATNEYDSWIPLSNPVPDAEAIGAQLSENFGFQVDIQRNLNRDDILLKIREYAQKNYGPNDQLFIFVAGHGQFDEILKQGYVVAKDSRKPDLAKSSYISHSNLSSYINSIPCKHIFLVMDVCFGGTFDPVVARRGESDYSSDREELIRRTMARETRRYLTSGGKEYVSDGIPGQHSPFARRLLEAFKRRGGVDGILTIGEIFNYVSLAKPLPQSGFFGNNEEGSDFLFIAR